MATLSFTTAKFDVSLEAPNPTNPIAGQGVLRWLREELGNTGYACTEPEPEDWGWYMDARGSEATYLVGASGEPEDSSPEVPWTVQVEKARSLADKLLGRNKLAGDDALVTELERLLRSEAAIRDLRVDRDG